MHQWQNRAPVHPPLTSTSSYHIPFYTAVFVQSNAEFFSNNYKQIELYISFELVGAGMNDSIVSYDCSGPRRIAMKAVQDAAFRRQANQHWISLSPVSRPATAPPEMLSPRASRATSMLKRSVP